MKDTKCSLHFRTNWYMIKNLSDESAARPLVSLQTRNACEAQSGFQVSCSNASPYPAQPRSVGTIAGSATCCLRTTAAFCSTWHYTLLRACVLCAIVLRLAGSHHDHCTYAKSFFVGELYGIDWPFFLEDDRLTERVSRSLLGTAEPEGSPAKLTRFFRLLKRAARATGRGRDSRRVSPRSIPRRAS